MGTGYTRNDTSNNIADGNIINAADFDGEYDAIEAAFNSSTGHTHDGTSAEGAPITVLGPSQEFVASSSEVKPSTNAGLDLGTNTLKFKDLYLDGTAYIDGLGGDILAATDKKIQFRDTAIFINSSADGQLDIDADTTIELNSPEVIATDDFRLKSDAAILTFGADNDVTVTHVADTGLDAKAASGFALKLQTGDTTIESGNTLGKISFNAPDEASGTDAILVGAEIEAAAEATFSSTVNSTALVFKTNDSAAATERVRIKSDGDVVFTGASANMTWDTSADSLDFQDGGQVALGSDDDLVITHSGSAGSITNATGDFTIDAAADIILDADGADIRFLDNGVQIGKITNASTNLEIHASQQDADIVFKGNDGGVTITALTLDMSAGGKATFAAGAVTEFQGATTITTNDNSTQLTLESTDTDANVGPVLELYRNSGSPADSDALGRITFSSENDADEKIELIRVIGLLSDASDSTEDGTLQYYIMRNGTRISRLEHSSTETVFNQDSQNVDFRVESDGNQNALFIDASEDKVGIGTGSVDSFSVGDLVVGSGSGTRGITLYSGNSNEGIIRFADGVTGDEQYRGQIKYDHSTDAMNLLAAGTGSSTPNIQISNTETIFNEGGLDRDFRVESDNYSHMLFVDAAKDQILLGSGDLNDDSVKSIVSIGGTNHTIHFAGGSATANTNGGGFMTSRQKDDSSTGWLTLGAWDGGTDRQLYYGGGNWGVQEATLHIFYAGAYDAGAGGATEQLRIDSGGVTVNDLSNDLDFRVESNSNANMLFVDGGNNTVSLGTSADPTSGTFAAPNLYIKGKATGIFSMVHLEPSSDTSVLGIGYDGTNNEFVVNSSYRTTGGFRDLVFQSRATTNDIFRIPIGAGTEMVVNDSSQDLDFRVESDNYTHAIEVEAGTDRVLMGKSVAGLGNAGHEFGLDGFLYHTRNGNVMWINQLASSGNAITFMQNSGTVGSIALSSSGTTYNTTSDLRLKTDIQPIADGTEKLMAMNPVSHKWIADPKADAVHGFIAQEMQDIVPEAVSGKPDDEDMMSMDYGRITPVLVAALQDAHKKIEALENRLAELEDK